MPNVTVGPEPPLDPLEDEPPPLPCDDEREEPDDPEDPEDFPLDPPEYPWPPPGRASSRAAAEHTSTVTMMRWRASRRGIAIWEISRPPRTESGTVESDMRGIVLLSTR